MTNAQLLAAHDYTPEDLQELRSAIALFHLCGLPFTPKGAYELVRKQEPPLFASWFRTWKLPAGFRVFEVTPSDKAGKFADVIQHRSLAFDWGSDSVPLRHQTSPCYWVVRLPDFYRAEKLKAHFLNQQPELALNPSSATA